jgi:hypothetical protein
LIFAKQRVVFGAASIFLRAGRTPEQRSKKLKKQTEAGIAFLRAG